MATRQPPTTAWGALLVAADLLEKSAGLARTATLQADYKAGKLDPYAALQDACWPPPEQIPRENGGIPKDSVTERPYWTALARLDMALGGTGDGMHNAIDRLCETQAETAQSVASAMRNAASPRAAVS